MRRFTIARTEPDRIAVLNVCNACTMYDDVSWNDGADDRESFSEFDLSYRADAYHCDDCFPNCDCNPAPTHRRNYCPVW